jgi:hypothetical protein
VKICTKCNIEKNVSLFNKKHGKPQSVCKECHSIYRKKHYENNKQKYIKKAANNKNKYRNDYYEWLSTKSCVDCGNSDIRVLEQDHLRDKSFSIAKMVGSVPLVTLMKEIEKCEVVCANCHRIRTSSRGGWARSKMG